MTAIPVRKAGIAGPLADARARRAGGRRLIILAIWEIGVRMNLPDFVATPSGVIRAIPSTMATAISGRTSRQPRGDPARRCHRRGRRHPGRRRYGPGARDQLVLSTYIRALYALPLIALVPLVIIWVGYQPSARLAIVIISTFLPVAVTTADGTRAINKEYLDVGKMFGARTHNVWFGIALPSALPHIIAGVELGFRSRHHQRDRGRGAGQRPGHGHVGVHQVERAERERLVRLRAVPGDLRGRRALADDPLPGLACALVHTVVGPRGLFTGLEDHAQLSSRRRRDRLSR